MVRLLRWGTFIVLILAMIGAAYSYPLLRDRFAPASLAGPAPQVTVLAETAAIAQATTLLPATPSSPTATTPALIIQAPSPTAVGITSTASSTAASPTPSALATTSLLPANSTEPAITPVVLGPTTVEQPRETLSATSTVAATSHTSVAASLPTSSQVITATSAVAIAVTLEPPTPTLAPVQPPAVGEKGYEPPVTPAVVSAEGAITTIVVTPIVVTIGEVSPTVSVSGVTPIVVTTVELTPQPDTPTPMPLGPTSGAESPLYSGPDFNSAIVGQVQVGEQLTIVGLYTEGTWYLLVNGMWISGAVVDHAPLTLPLVSPTITPVPTSTPTITPTPLPTATPLGSATPTPTPTSLEQPVCDCSGDTLDCLGNIFDNRAEAQQCFEYCFRQTGRDIHLLDPNLNGMACENLP